MPSKGKKDHPIEAQDSKAQGGDHLRGSNAERQTVAPAHWSLGLVYSSTHDLMHRIDGKKKAEVHNICQ